MSKETKTIVRLAIVAGLYIALTWAVLPISYGAVQFRISEVLVLLCFYRRDYVFALIIGCFIANFLSPIYLIDVPVGTIATALSVFLISKSRNLIIASIFPVIINGIIIGLELHLVLDAPLFLSIFYVALGELGVMILGVLIFKTLGRNKFFLEIIEANQNLT